MLFPRHVIWLDWNSIGLWSYRKWVLWPSDVQSFYRESVEEFPVVMSALRKLCRCYRQQDKNPFSMIRCPLTRTTAMTWVIDHGEGKIKSRIIGFEWWKLYAPKNITTWKIVTRRKLPIHQLRNCIIVTSYLIHQKLLPLSWLVRCFCPTTKTVTWSSGLFWVFTTVYWSWSHDTTNLCITWAQTSSFKRCRVLGVNIPPYWSIVNWTPFQPLHTHVAISVSDPIVSLTQVK